MVLVPTATEFLAADGVRKIYEAMAKLKKEQGWLGRILGILPTFYDEQTRESRTQLDEYRKIFKEVMLSPIHRTTILRECPAEGRTIFEIETTTNSAQRAVQEYQAVVEHVLKAR
jgi:chromosome partitioning protein